MAQWADFSARPPGATALRAAGFAGVIRYIGLGSEGKQIHRSEFEDYSRNGMGVLLVAELGISDAWAALNDYATGVARAQMAVADARAEGIPDYVPIAWAADSHATAAQVRDAVEYGRGFQAVLGARSGAYGFMETLRAVRAAGVASWYWLAGSKPAPADQQWVNIWQRNDSTRAVGGTVCDINEIYALPGAGQENDMQWTEVVNAPSPGVQTYSEDHTVGQFIGSTYYWAADTFRAVTGVLVPAITALIASHGEGLDQDAVMARIDTAVREATGQAVAGTILPALKTVLADVLGADNAAQADAIVTALAARLAA